MANRRRHVQELHERFNVNLFLKEFNARYHADFKVVGEPNPPEAIIQSKHTTRWVEVTTAYLNEAYAIDLNTYAVKGEKHLPSSATTSGNAEINVDDEFAKHFVRVVRNKLEKPNYESYFRAHGKGYLVVSIKDPFFGQSTLAAIQRVWDSAAVSDKGFFKSVYIVYPIFGEYKVSLWKSNLR